VRVPIQEIGAAAVAALMARIEEPDRPPTVTVMKTELVVRESSG
jgi:DNA-binding LacI/PurR family transcriptional regulator